MSLEWAKHGWEYANIFIKFDEETFEESEKSRKRLNEYGRSGWELVQMSPYEAKTMRGYIAFFKRPLKDPI